MLSSNDLRRRGDRPLLMGILNVTPDSFSDGGQHFATEAAVEHAFRLVDEGADMIDIGGESTRPGATPVPAAEELARLLPVIDRLSDSIGVPLSVDTMKASVARACVEHGVDVVNDVSGFSDPDMVSVVAELQVPLVVMSSYGDPSTFKTRMIPGDAVVYMRSELERLIGVARSAGIRDDMIVTDPGIGFGTNPEQGMALVDHASEFTFDGRYPVLIGPSRKRFLSTFYPEEDPDTATAQVCLRASEAGADILRIHAPGRVKGFFDGF